MRRIREQQALSLRRLLLTERAITRSNYLRARPGREAALCRCYESGDALVDLARAEDLPPIALFRAVLGARDEGVCSEGQLRVRMRRALQHPERHLIERDSLELEGAMRQDASSFVSDDDKHGQRRGAPGWSARCRPSSRRAGSSS